MRRRSLDYKEISKASMEQQRTINWEVGSSCHEKKILKQIGDSQCEVTLEL